MTAREIVDEILPKYKPTRYNNYFFGFTESNYIVAKEEIITITAEIINKGADPAKLRKIYQDLARTPEARDTFKIFDAIHRLHSMVIAHIEKEYYERTNQT